MLHFLWLARLRERWLGKHTAGSRRRNRLVARRSLYHRLELERLENRIVPSITLLSSQQGINLDNSSGGWVPPDTQGGAGPNSYVETTNATVAMYGKSSGTTLGQDSLPDFFFTQGGLKNIGGLGDAFSAYDSLAGRFIVGDIDIDFAGNNALVLAVSKSSNPTTLTSSDWYFYEISTNEPSVFIQDYPGNLGYNDESVVITFNSFGGPSHVFVNAFSIDALTSGATLSKGTNYFQTDFSGWSLRPTYMQDSTNPNDPMWFVEEAGDDKSINVVQMANVLSNTPTYTTTNLGVNPYYPAVYELNPGGSAINYNTDSRIMNASMVNGQIVAAHQVSDAAGNLDEIQWYEIDTSGAAPTLKDEGDVSGGPGTYYAYPGIAINSGGLIGMSYAASGIAAGQYLSTYITGRTPADATGTMETPVLALAGTVNDNDGREGDMSAINVDSDGTFWIANEIAEHSSVYGANSWGTDIAHFRVGHFVNTTASSATTVYSTHTQTISLSATVTALDVSLNPVNEGSVTFTIENGGTVIATAVGAVSNGTAAVNVTLPAGLAAGSYTLAVSYVDSAGFFVDLTDTDSTLTVNPAQVKTAANLFNGYFSPNLQTVTVGAILADASIPSDEVNEGAVIFLIKNSSNKTIASGQGTVSNDTASAIVLLPPALAPGGYTILVLYGDPLYGNFIDAGDTSVAFNLASANVITTAANIVTAFSPNNQTVKLSANVADSSTPGDTVNEGTVTFTVTDSSNNTLGTVQGTVAGGIASANFSLNGAQALGAYTVTVSYNDSSTGHFADSGDVKGTLTIGSALVTTTAGNIAAAYSPNTQTVTLGAGVADSNIPGDTVNEGIVTFTITASSGTQIGTAQAAVVGGLANYTFTLPAGLAAGSYTLAVSYSDSSGHFSDSKDNNATLTIKPAAVSTTAAAYTPSPFVYSAATQTLNLSATLADASHSGDLIGEGIVTFTVKYNSQIIGNAYATVQAGTTSGGTANTTFNWSAGRPAGVYTIAVAYADNVGNYTDSSDTSEALTVNAASVTVAAGSPPPVVSSSAQQNVTLTATVTDASFPNDTVNEGTVTFTVTDKNGNGIGSPVTGVAVTGGVASTVFSLPGGNPVGNYSIAASYADSINANGAYNFNSSATPPAKTGTLTIQPANVATTANSVSYVYSSLGQSLKLTASVANISVPANTVGEGTVTFTVTDKNGNPVGTAQGLVSGGTAAATLNLTAAQAVPGSYTIAVKYSDTSGSGNFVDAGDASSTLTITPAKVTTTAGAAAATYSPNSQSVTLSAAVTDASNSSDIVGEGIVTFTVSNGSTPVGSVQANVSNGTATTQFTLPAGQALGSYTVTVSYSDSSGNYTDNGDRVGTLTITPASVATTANPLSVVYSPNAQTLNLSAGVADTSAAVGSPVSVDEGTVTFTVASGSTVLGSVQATVTGGTATNQFALPAGQAAGNYTITVSYNDTTSHFLDAGDSGSTLTISTANVTTKANNVAAAFSPNLQTMALSANVADASNSKDTVSQGSVTFTIKSGSTTIGTATGLVSGGTADAVLSWPAGQALGTYSIVVGYSDGANANNLVNFTDSGDTGATLTVGQASVAVTANSISTVYNANSQNVALRANVTDASVPTDIVTEGVVTFTIQSGSTTLGSVQATVASGAANAQFTLPAGLSAGSYTVAAHYSDTTGSSNFVDTGDTGGALTIAPVSVTTTAASASTTFSTAAQTLDFSATVAGPGSTARAVNEGAVTFTLLSGSTVIGSVQGAVTGGTAHAAVTLPAGQAAGNYVLAVHYSDPNGNFGDSSDSNGTLAVGVATSTAQLLQAQFAPNYSNLTVTETVTAHITSSTLVDRGTVTFTLSGQTITTSVDANGNATIVLTLPMTALLNPQLIGAAYADTGHNLTSSSDTEVASWQESTPLLPTSAGFSPNSVTMDLFGLLITFTNGVLTEIDYGSIHVDFIYSAGGLAQITVDGVDLLP